jgi:AcrR family transcriptional regulator
VHVQPEDLTARARIRGAALELFSQQGVGATSMRSVAARAGVSPSLVVHHFGSKAGLREAVDRWVVGVFADVLGGLDLDQSFDGLGSQIEHAISTVIGGDRHLRDYLALSLAAPGDASQRLFDDLMDLLERGIDGLDRSGHVNPAIDRTWRSYTAAFIVLGPVLLSHRIEPRLGVAAFDPAAVRDRSRCNMGVLSSGLFRE